MQDLAREPLAKDLPQTKRGHERCIALLISATELFLERGYDAVSLDDIVQHAGGSKASIYKYFGNKEGGGVSKSMLKKTIWLLIK